MKFSKWHFQKFLIFCVGGDYYNSKSQNCDWVLFFVTRFLISRTRLRNLNFKILKLVPKGILAGSHYIKMAYSISFMRDFLFLSFFSYLRNMPFWNSNNLGFQPSPPQNWCINRLRITQNLSFEVSEAQTCSNIFLWQNLNKRE